MFSFRIIGGGARLDGHHGARGGRLIPRPAALRQASVEDDGRVLKNPLRTTSGDELPALLEKIFGDGAGAAAAAELGGDSEPLIEAVARGAGQRAVESLDEQIRGRRERPRAQPAAAPEAKTNSAPKAKPKGRPAARPKRVASGGLMNLDWRQLAFGFRPLPRDGATTTYTWELTRN